MFTAYELQLIEIALEEYILYWRNKYPEQIDAVNILTANSEALLAKTRTFQKEQEEKEASEKLAKFKEHNRRLNF